MRQSVYLISDGRYTKIGVSKNVGKRLKSLQTASPRRLYLVGQTPGSEALERQLHERFAPQRVHGEWFDLSEADVLSILNAAPPPAPPRVSPSLEVDAVDGLAERFPRSGDYWIDDLGAAKGACSRAGCVGAGVARTLALLRETDSLQDQYEVLLLAALRDIRHHDARTRYLDGVIRELEERMFARMHREDAEAEPLWRYDCRQYLPLVSTQKVLKDSGEVWYSEAVCLKAMRLSFERLVNAGVLERIGGGDAQCCDRRGDTGRGEDHREL